MKIRKPSPAMIVSLIALVMATTGSAVAVTVNFARNSDAVDGKSAVSARATQNQARGKLVATARGGRDSGQIPAKFLSDGVVHSDTFGLAFEVVDNQNGATMDLFDQSGFGKLSANCVDQNRNAGREDPSTNVTFSNLSGTVVNLARRVGTSAVEISALANGAADTFTINGSNTFTLHLERSGANLLVDGAVRQDGRNTGTASCLIFGAARIVSE